MHRNTTSVSEEPEQETKRKGANPTTLLRKAEQCLAEAAQKLRLDESRAVADDERVLKILRTAFANKAVENTIKHHPSISDLDRDFLRQVKGWSV